VGDSSDSPQQVDGLIGTVVRGPFGTGSKSARDAVWLETEKGRFVLRRKEGPTFGDLSFDQYVGKRVICDGFIVGYMMLVERILTAPNQKTRP
jgi:hypothetical protein